MIDTFFLAHARCSTQGAQKNEPKVELMNSHILCVIAPINLIYLDEFNAIYNMSRKAKPGLTSVQAVRAFMNGHAK